MAVETLSSLPKHFKDILKMRKEDQEPWMTAMKEEIKSLHERKVWDPTRHCLFHYQNVTVLCEPN